MRRQLQSPFNERQYMLSKDFEIYYYNDNHFYGVTDHTHDYYEFYFFLEGNVTISIEKEHHHLKPGDMVFIPRVFTTMCPVWGKHFPISVLFSGSVRITVRN